MIEHLPPLLLAWSIQLTSLLSPGPSVALILGVATARGRGPALITAFGIGSAAIVLSLATVFGLAAVFAEVAELMLLVKLFGAAYLMWLAYGSFRKALNPPPIDVALVQSRSIWRTGLSGFILQVSNPKAIFFWVVIASVGIGADAPALIIAVFMLVAFANSVLVHCAWALILSASPVRRAYVGARRPIEAALGCFFTFAAFRLATARS